MQPVADAPGSAKARKQKRAAPFGGHAFAK